jgi:acetoin utilization deacetylase AcuC-like enzyme
MNRTGLFQHAACRLHEMGDGHPECPERLGAINDRLLASGLDGFLQHMDAPAANPAELLLAHDAAHVGAIGQFAEELARGHDPGRAGYRQVDPDTAMNRHSWEAALHAAGAAVAATDAVIAGELQNAFCAVRPPGHHACRDHAMGFCLFNNVAIAALHALTRHGLQRVAIVDFDVHHGNGTEDIVAGDERILMASFYQHPFYPYGGPRSDAPNLVNLPVPAYTGGRVVRELIQRHWLPRLEAHRPQMIFISAGFDAHREDELGQMGLVEDDYRWITEQLVLVAARHSQGRIVSCLEGGYNLSALGRSVEAHLRALADL